jgi:hypothetical protein
MSADVQRQIAISDGLTKLFGMGNKEAPAN